MQGGQGEPWRWWKSNGGIQSQKGELGQLHVVWTNKRPVGSFWAFNRCSLMRSRWNLMWICSLEKGERSSGVQDACRCELRDKMRKCNLPYPPAFPYSGLCGTKIAWDSWRQHEDMIFAISRKLNF